VSLFVQSSDSHSRYTMWAGEVESTCKALDFWICNPRLSGRGRNGPGRPSGIPQECTWITARVEVHFNSRCTSYIQICGATSIDDRLASGKVMWRFFLRVGVCMGLLRATVHQQKVKLISENRPHAPIILHVVHKQSEQLICNLPPSLEAINDGIA